MTSFRGKSYEKNQRRCVWTQKKEVASISLATSSWL